MSRPEVIPRRRRRTQTPENKEEFEGVTITLKEDHWQLSKSAATGKTVLSDSARVGLNALIKAITDAGEKPMPMYANHIPASARVVNLGLWRKYFYMSVGSDEDDEKRTQDSKKKAFQRARETLLAKARIAMWDDWVWIVT